ncbi:MAG: metal-dependent transcriptional regulator [Saprospiraceae bacterium]
MASPTEENYLKALLALADAEGNVSMSDLSNALGVSTPTANSMVKKLRDQELVHYEKYRPLRLTERGRQEAGLVLRKHRLTEMFLVEKMGFAWDQVHTIAEQIEHIQSPAFFERMDELMGSPTLDPHGSPIPDREGKLVLPDHVRLADCRPGSRVRLAGLMHSSAEFLRFLTGKDLALNSVLHILAREDFDGSLTVSYPGHDREMLSRSVTEQILVEEMA